MTTYPVESADWVHDDYGDDSPYNVGHLDDDGEFFKVKGGDKFQKQLDSFNLLRKSVEFGDEGWLTAEVATRDYDKDGSPDTQASLENVKLPKGNHAGGIEYQF